MQEKIWSCITQNINKINIWDTPLPCSKTSTL